MASVSATLVRPGKLKGEKKKTSLISEWEKGKAEFIPESGAESPEYAQQLFFLNAQRKTGANSPRSFQFSVQ